MPESLSWKPFMVPMPVQRKRMIEVTDVGPAGQVFFDPVSHYLFKHTSSVPKGEVSWHVADLPCSREKRP